MIRTATVVLVLLVAAVPALAARQPTDTERTEIGAALDKRGFNCSLYPEGHCERIIRISTVQGRWAGAYLKGTPGHRGEVQPEGGSLKLKNGRWRVNELGPDVNGCGMPKRVRKDLRLYCYQ